MHVYEPLSRFVRVSGRVCAFGAFLMTGYEWVPVDSLEVATVRHRHLPGR